MSRTAVATVLFLATTMLSAQEPPDRQPLVVLDESTWVSFYDLPTRRFLDIRAALGRGDTARAARDLAVTSGYMGVEADRSTAILQAPLRNVVARLAALAEAPASGTADEFDRLFRQSHWLLAQHYLDLARQSRDKRQNRNASLYLWATTHHMERTLIGSNVAVTPAVRRTLDQLRETADRLREAKSVEGAWREKPVVRADALLRQIGKQVDRPVLLAPAPEAGGRNDGR